MIGYKVLDIDYNKNKTSARLFDHAGGFRYQVGIVQVHNPTEFSSQTGAYWSFCHELDAQCVADKMIPADGKTRIIPIEMNLPCRKSYTFDGQKFDILISKSIYIAMSEYKKLL
jgi:hypothetical protein